MTSRPLLACVVVVIGCAHGEARTLRRQAKTAGRAVKRAQWEEFQTHVLPGARPRVDFAAIAGDPGRERWARSLGRPKHVRPEATVFLGAESPVAVVWTEGGWRFAEDPTRRYSQRTPREALRSLVRASRAKRWDVLIELAPRRYRLGLSGQDLERAWTQGEHAKQLLAARDRLSEHLADAIVSDAHEAVLDLGNGHVARLEREGDRWVVVDF